MLKIKPIQIRLIDLVSMFPKTTRILHCAFSIRLVTHFYYHPLSPILYQFNQIELFRFLTYFWATTPKINITTVGYDFLVVHILTINYKLLQDVLELLVAVFFFSLFSHLSLFYRISECLIAYYIYKYFFLSAKVI